MTPATPTLKQKAVHEFKEYLIVALYLWVVFGLLELHRSAILAEYHIDFAFQGLAVINALALGKVMLIAKELHFAHQLDDAPLIYPILVKSFAFAVLLGIFKILEDAGLGAYRGKSFHQSIADLAGGRWAGIVTLTGLVGLLLIPFFGFTELNRIFGEGTLKQVFIRPRHSLDLSAKES
jgi:hypothetical protein